MFCFFKFSAVRVKTTIVVLSGIRGNVRLRKAELCTLKHLVSFICAKPSVSIYTLSSRLAWASILTKKPPGNEGCIDEKKDVLINTHTCLPENMTHCPNIAVLSATLAQHYNNIVSCLLGYFCNKWTLGPCMQVLNKPDILCAFSTERLFPVTEHQASGTDWRSVTHTERCRSVVRCVLRVPVRDPPDLIIQSPLLNTRRGLCDGELWNNACLTL